MEEVPSGMESSSLKRRRGLLRFGIIGVVLVVVAALVILPLRFIASSDTEPLTVYWELPSFAFTDQFGRTVASEDLRGKVIVANFIFTNCIAFCPTLLTPRMRELQGRLRDEGLAGREVVLLSFSVDPEQDTPEILQAYAEKYGADPEVWRFLSTSTVADMKRVVTLGLKLGVEKTLEPVEHGHPDGSVHLHKYDVAHTSRFVLVDRQGQVRASYSGVQDWNLNKVLKDIRQLVGSSQ